MDVRGLYGFTIMKDLSSGIGHAADDDAKQTMYFGRPGEGEGYAWQFQNFRVVSSENFSGYRILADFNHGAALTDNRKIRLVKQSIT